MFVSGLLAWGGVQGGGGDKGKGLIVLFYWN